MKSIKHFYCLDCGKEITRYGIRCGSCAKKGNRCALYKDGRSLKQRLNNTDKYNMVDWFKIESQVFESNDSATVDSTGKNPKVFLYRVVLIK